MELPPQASFGVVNADGVRLNLSRRQDTLLVETEATLQVETEIEELLQRQEEQAVQTDSRQTRWTWERALALLAVGAAIGILIRKQTNP